MKKIPLTRVLFALAGSLGSAAAESGIVDLINLPNYADQAIPNYVTRDNTPADNPITDLGATLGRVLFYDTRLSTNNMISCASCHQQENAFGDFAVASTGVNGTTNRHSMRLINNRFSQETTRFWDERSADLETQSTQPIRDHIEMGFSGENGDPDFADLATKLSDIEEYQVLFHAVFGDGTVSEDRIQRSLGQFIRSIQSFDSKYDEGRAQVNNDDATFPNFTADENAGKALFMNDRAAGCATCHQAPEFDIDPDSDNNGVITSLDGSIDLTNTRSPSLRDMVGPNGESNGAFMHDGSLATLADVVDHYDLIPESNQNLDNRLDGRNGGQELNLSVQEKAQLVAFLETLSGTSVYEDEKFSDPFDENGQLSLVMLPLDGMEILIEEDSDNPELTITSRGVPNMDYMLQASTDLTNWSETEITADAEGSLSVTMPMLESQPKMLFRFVYETDE